MPSTLPCHLVSPSLPPSPWASAWNCSPPPILSRSPPKSVPCCFVSLFCFPNVKIQRACATPFSPWFLTHVLLPPPPILIKLERPPRPFFGSSTRRALIRRFRFVFLFSTFAHRRMLSFPFFSSTPICFYPRALSLDPPLFPAASPFQLSC